MTRGARHWLANHRKELALACAASLLGLAIAELGGRLLVASDTRLPLFHRGEHRFYPRLHRAMQDYDPSSRNVLLLGGSVIMRIPPDTWRERVPGARFYNVAFKAHTSLDSLYKYEQLRREGYRFDVVVFYHGVNEVRTNNAPPGIFRDDYSHYAFYRMAHTLFRDRDTAGSWLARNTFLGYGLALLRLDSVQDQLMALYDAPKYDIPQVKKAVVRYMLVCAKKAPEADAAETRDYGEQAQENLARLRRKDPNTFREAERFFIIN